MKPTTKDQVEYDTLDADIFQCLACGYAWTESRDGYAMYFESRPLRRHGSGTNLPGRSSRPDLGTRGHSGAASPGGSELPSLGFGESSSLGTTRA